ncbi:glycosyl transferase family 2 [Xylanimonas cellulosilytica DSM 15894]|uniref:Glycosyl transferase family 2 n=1 Tax=Xylanimonas cellulosilytica (strain DSM 15894 / JCM 12276 / CECT 5975 / KCTC 9989 / LMG 20990 / NBRC 107835 / XIL07) TaxID=446471 RepID=D1BZX6_XYLCX|nr:glycosyltransferase [Xylanimonas cellulosilytica]ACZ32104.1 glycosyl transferase family 2 [Xylanimonas cellulosilytica DSM 15894]
MTRIESDAPASPRVSVVIPCYNYARYLPDAVESVLTQDGIDLDVTIIDDASTDDSVEVAQRYVDADPRVRLVRHLDNRGHVETSNEALGLATGQYVVELDADDVVTPGSLARSAALLQAHPEVAFCYGYAEQFLGPIPRDVPSRVRGWSVWPGDTWVERVLKRGHNPICQPEVMIRRAALVEAGGYHPELRWAEDLHLWLRLAMRGSVGRVNGPTQGLYRMHPDSFTRSASDPELTDVRARVAAIDRFFAGDGGRLAQPEKVHRSALAALGRNARAVAARVTDRDPVHREFVRLADELQERSGVRSERSLAGSPTWLGAAYRQVDARVRWRLRRRYGV